MAGSVVAIDGSPSFTFNGRGGDDQMIVNLNTFALPSGGVFFNGGDQDAPLTAGANAVHGDVLVVNDTTGTLTGTYQPNGVVNPAWRLVWALATLLPPLVAWRRFRLPAASGLNTATQ